MDNNMFVTQNGKKSIIQYLKLMRVHHYLKNLLIFSSIIFSRNLFDFYLLKITIIGFISFSILASIVYIINDIKDVEKDRKHPKKCKRPIASGAVSVKSAYVLAGILFIIGMLLNVYICKTNVAGWIVLLGYLLINFAYSMKLKNLPIIDITILALGFLFRVLYGSIIINIEISNWLYLTVLAISFYLGLGKRRNELKTQGDKTRKVLKYYNNSFLDKNMYMCLAVTIVFYSLWCVDPMTIAKYAHNYLIYTVPLVMIICMKYSLNIEGESDGDPINVLLGDKLLITLISVYVIVIFFLIYIL